MNINQLLELVKQRSDAKSLRKIADAIGVANPSVSGWARGRALPVDENIEKLCELAGEDPDLWLLKIRQDAVEGSAKERWRKMEEVYINSKSSPLLTGT
ncbi:helix-turn-helix domain-containing protein [Cohaesibacter celericrescens]|uniref:HTH cro/C1-type domain-containing protein n=1 Tax=Cohaesibacter celericrescens TaxID=2067669 RepID=A0A2N5XLU2_9HYPH|nr:helix-turn-helix transcriptional regulator [Cohaesibacter celericrescens]PLW75398.1 hypothetical protein C0081_20240 [Cohaesibacter celericrescens]